jgi:hypothetical protein
MVGLSDLGVSEADVLSVRRILEPYLVLVANFLALASDRDKVEGGVNSEQKSGEVFTVHRTLSSSAEKAQEKL